MPKVQSDKGQMQRKPGEEAAKQYIQGLSSKPAGQGRREECQIMSGSRRR